MSGFCTQCGATLTPGQRFCTSCGAVCDAGMASQTSVGAPPQAAYPVESQAAVPASVPQKKGFFSKLKKQFGGSSAQPVVQMYPQQQVPPQPQSYQPQQPVYNGVNAASYPLNTIGSDASNGFAADDYATVYQPDCDADDEATTVFEEPYTYVLVREATGEQLPLAFPAVLGKGSAATCLIAGNSKISRAHARLDIQGDQLTLEDMGSTNHTKLEGQELAPGVPVQLAFGQVFHLCDEAFFVQELFE